jgi:outer membrane protein, heavy metal efflux system
MLFRCFVAVGLALAHTAYAAELDRAITLQQATSIALERNHDLQLAATALTIARANLLSADSAPNPTLAVSLWRKEIDTIVGVNQLLERGGKRALRAESARFRVNAAAQDLGDVRRQLRLMVAQAYTDLHAAQDRVLASQDGARLLDAALLATQLRREAGDIAGADVERVRVEALRARNDVNTAQADQRRAQQLLAFLLADPDSLMTSRCLILQQC